MAIVLISLWIIFLFSHVFIFSIYWTTLTLQRFTHLDLVQNCTWQKKKKKFRKHEISVSRTQQRTMMVTAHLIRSTKYMLMLLIVGLLYILHKIKTNCRHNRFSLINDVRHFSQHWTCVLLWPVPIQLPSSKLKFAPSFKERIKDANGDNLAIIQRS